MEKEETILQRLRKITREEAETPGILRVNRSILSETWQVLRRMKEQARTMTPGEDRDILTAEYEAILFSLDMLTKIRAKKIFTASMGAVFDDSPAGSETYSPEERSLQGQMIGILKTIQEQNRGKLQFTG